MSCISTASISVLWNGQIKEYILPSRGIRQGDPLSPYTFVLCLECFSHMIALKVADKVWKSLRIYKDVSISHLLLCL